MSGNFHLPDFVRLELRPMPQQLRLGLWGMLAAAGLALLYFGLISDAPLPDHRLIVGWNDLLLHVVGFASLALVAFTLFSPMLRVACCVMLLGVGLEFLQVFSRSHEPSLRDALANGAGISAAAVAFLALRWAVFLCRQWA